MDTKKLIGTIIGVTMFAVLIAGATFAWLTFGTTVGDNVYQGQTMHFLVDYTVGTEITYMPILDSTLAKPAATATSNPAELAANEAAALVVVLKKNAGSADGHGAILLNTTSSTTLTTGGVVKWAICRDTDVEEGTQVDDVCGGDADFSAALNTGTITTGGTTSSPSTIYLLNDAKLADGKTGSALGAAGGTSSTNNIIQPGGVSYFVYFWYDGETIQNHHLYDANKNGQIDSNETTVLNPLYSGYISAEANQLQN